MYYSASTNGVYDDPSNYRGFPADAKEITEEVYNECFRDRPVNKMVSPGADGYPVLVDMPGPTNEELASSVRFIRDEKLRLIYDVECAAVQRKIRLASGDAELLAQLSGKLAELDLYAESLTSVPQQSGFPNTIIWPEDPVL